MRGPVRKLLNGLSDFQDTLTQADRDNFSHLALGQKPDAMLFACSDSRVAPNVFASSDPGDLFVVRNVGNMVSPSGDSGFSVGDVSEAAALEFAVTVLEVKDIIICGHSECGAINALYNGLEIASMPNLKDWIKNGNEALTKFKNGVTFNPSISPVNQISQLNALTQVENVRSYPYVEKRVQAGTLKVSAWWFDIAKGKVSIYLDERRQFVEVDRTTLGLFLQKLGN